MKMEEKYRNYEKIMKQKENNFLLPALGNKNMLLLFLW